MKTLILTLFAAFAALTSTTFAGAEDEVKALAGGLRGNRAALEKLKPTAAQIAQIAATDEDAKALAAYVETLYAGLPAAGIDGKPGQSEVLVTSGKSLPGGYAMQAEHFKKGVEFSRLQIHRARQDARHGFRQPREARRHVGDDPEGVARVCKIAAAPIAPPARRAPTRSHSAAACGMPGFGNHPHARATCRRRVPASRLGDASTPPAPAAAPRWSR